MLWSMLVVVTMTTVPAMHEYVHKRTHQKYQPGQGAEKMDLVLAPKQKQRNDRKYRQYDFITPVHNRPFSK